MIKTIIFDIGGVLIGYDWKKHMMKLFNNDEELVEKVRSNVFGTFDGGKRKWDEVDRGVMTEEELLDLFSKDAPELRKEIELFWNTAGDALWQYDFAKAWLNELKDKGYQILYLSNWSAHLRELADTQLDFLPMFDGGVFSYEEKLIKPDHAIFKTILERYNLNASECVFLDDTERNIIGARECGINTVWVENKDHEIALKRLTELL